METINVTSLDEAFDIKHSGKYPLSKKIMIIDTGDYSMGFADKRLTPKLWNARQEARKAKQ